MLKYGVISEVDASKGRARVNFQEDEMVSDWLPVSLPGSLNSKVEFWPAVNTHVWCVMDENAENGVIGGAIYDDSNTPETGNEDISVIVFKDGTRVEYDAANSKLTIDCSSEILVKASGTVTLDAPTVELTGDMNVQGQINAVGKIESQSEVTAGIINLTSHKHVGVQPGLGSTGTPIP